MSKQKFEENKPHVIVGTIGHIERDKISLISTITRTLKVLHDDAFVLVEASKLSLNDDFMNFEPQKQETKAFYEQLLGVINKGVKDFYKPRMDPSFIHSREWFIYGEIEFIVGKEPAVGGSYKSWKKAAKNFASERGSRLGTKSEYIAYLGVLIKELVSFGWTKERAWNAVCCDSAELGHYSDSKEAKYKLEVTGSREILGLYDLGNTYKFLSDDDMDGALDVTGFWIAGGCFCDDGKESPLATLEQYFDRHTDFDFGIGWIILEK